MVGGLLGTLRACLKKLPSPFGRGAGGEGIAAKQQNETALVATSPHPCPLPKGEGTRQIVPKGERTRHGKLRSYEIRRGDFRRRIHLRSAAAGDALLLIDATEAIHLNPTAALLARFALDSVPSETAAAKLGRKYRVDAAEARRATAEIYALVEKIAAIDDACPTCKLTAPRVAPFSRPIAGPYKADLALTYDCNNNCPHCYNRDRDRLMRLTLKGDRHVVSPRKGRKTSRSPGNLTTAQWRRAIKRLARAGIPHVIFTGGEPTLCDDLLPLVRWASRLGLICGLNTNGRRLADPALAAMLREAGLDHVQITFESHHPSVHNAMTAAASFDETVAGIRNSLAAGLHTITNTTLTRRNAAHAAGIVDFLHGLGVRNFAVNGMIHSGGGCRSPDALPAQDLAPLLAHIRDRAAELGMRFLWYTPTEYCRLSPLELELGPRRCNAGEGSICVEPNGDVLPCQSYYVAAGNILRDPWEKIWQSDLFLSFRRRAQDPRASGLPERCAECPDLPVCGGGCRLERESHAAAAGFPSLKGSDSIAQGVALVVTHKSMYEYLRPFRGVSAKRY
jgi:radical SAM protein with 4Fe4S-binding SPASM domain